MSYRGEIAICPMCGKEFAKSHPLQVYCDPVCQLKSSKLRKREYSKRYYATHKEQEKRARQKRRGGDIKPLEPNEAAEQAVASLSAVQRERLRFLFMPARRITIDGEEWK